MSEMRQCESTGTNSVTRLNGKMSFGWRSSGMAILGFDGGDGIVCTNILSVVIDARALHSWFTERTG